MSSLGPEFPGSDEGLAELTRETHAACVRLVDEHLEYLEHDGYAIGPDATDEKQNRGLKIVHFVLSENPKRGFGKGPYSRVLEQAPVISFSSIDLTDLTDFCIKRISLRNPFEGDDLLCMKTVYIADRTLKSPPVEITGKQINSSESQPFESRTLTADLAYLVFGIEGLSKAKNLKWIIQKDILWMKSVGIDIDNWGV